MGLEQEVEIHNAGVAEIMDMTGTLPERIPIKDFEDYGITAFMTTRHAGTYGFAANDPVGEVITRWSALQKSMAGLTRSFVLAPQVHGSKVLAHSSGWEGLLRSPEADGHISRDRGIAMAVTVADCVPVFMAHHSGTAAVLHSGWMGTALKIIHEGVRAFGAYGIPADEILVHLGPSICGRCYEVDAETREKLTGMPANRPGCVDLRSIIVEDARSAGIQRVSVSELCTSCDNDLLFSHRKGDAGRQIGVIVAGR